MIPTGPAVYLNCERTSLDLPSLWPTGAIPLRNVKGLLARGARMVRIRSLWGVLGFAAVGAAIAATASALLIFFMMPSDRAVEGAIKAVICASIVSFPMIAVLAQKIRENQQLAEDLQYLIDHDRLTDVATRDRFFQKLAQTNDLPGVVMMVDIDHFKRINDSHGHLAGDEVIRAVAQAIDRNTRREDVVARFGGEEFVAFLTNCDLQQGGLIAERLRRTVEWIEVTTDAGASVWPTVSIGVAPIVVRAEVDRAVNAADQALYEAKNGGRNVACVAGQGLVAKFNLPKRHTPRDPTVERRGANAQDGRAA